MRDYDSDAYDADAKKVAELMTKMQKPCEGYSRMVIALACSRTIAAMFGPAKDESRDDFLRRFPGYVRAMWRAMDEAIPRPQR
jgi:hypothetical protein